MDTNSEQLLTEILKWQRLQGIVAFKAQISILLDSKEKKEVFELSDGTLSAKQISEKVKVATGTISNWWNKWLAEGILFREGNRYIKITSAEGLFIEKKEEIK